MSTPRPKSPAPSRRFGGPSPISPLRLGELLLVAGRFDDAAAFAERVKQASPFDERAHRLAIAAQLQRRDRGAVAAAVAAARAMLDGLGVEPEPGTRMLFRQAAEQLERYGSAA